MSDLEARAVSQFDSLVQKGELFYEPTTEIKIEQEPFDVRPHRPLGKFPPSRDNGLTTARSRLPGLFSCLTNNTN